MLARETIKGTLPTKSLLTPPAGAPSIHPILKWRRVVDDTADPKLRKHLELRDRDPPLTRVRPSARFQANRVPCKLIGVARCSLGTQGRRDVVAIFGDSQAS